ncbi:MAG TPA: MEDS domain-containing protein [Tepidisphaeraceae bacterium]|nr:MEDS domain-containing protein [Tepidisphaeraceae bacterium]
MRETSTSEGRGAPGGDWDSIAPGDHVVQVYAGDRALLDALDGYVSAGLRAGDGVVVIATPEHVAALERRLIEAGPAALARARREGRYVVCDAARTLASFMHRGWPEDALFEAVVNDLAARAGRGGRRVRAFGEMVALLWRDGQTAAAIRLEHLWAGVCRARPWTLFCAYPRSGFAPGDGLSVRHVCAAHTGVIAG